MGNTKMLASIGVGGPDARLRGEHAACPCEQTKTALPKGRSAHAPKRVRRRDAPHAGPPGLSAGPEGYCR